MRAATGGVGVVVLMLVSACQHDTARSLASQGEHPAVSAAVAAPGTGAAPGIAAETGSQRFSACGASFDIPGDWMPEQLAGGEWRVNGRAAAHADFQVSVRCLPDQVISPGAQFTEFDAVREVLGYGPDTLHRGTLEYRLWRDDLPKRPGGLIALLQADDDGPGRIEVAVWDDPGKRSPYDPPSKSQGLLAIHWSDDDPQQVARYTALRTQIISSFSAPLPDGRDRTRTP